MLDPRTDVQQAAERIRDALTRLGCCYRTKRGDLIEVSYRQLGVVSDRYAVLEVDVQRKQVVKRTDIVPPPHEPGKLPPWLAELGATTVLAGGMGQRAQQLFANQGIRVVVGAAVDTPERLVADFLAGTLEVGINACDH